MKGAWQCLGCSWAHSCTNPSLQASTICRLTLLHVDVDSEALNMMWRGHQRASLRCFMVADGCGMLHVLELYEFCHAWGMSKDVQQIESVWMIEGKQEQNHMPWHDIPCYGMWHVTRERGIATARRLCLSYCNVPQHVESVLGARPKLIDIRLMQVNNGQHTSRVAK